MENSHDLNIEQLIPLLRAELQAGRSVTLTVRSNSMLPLLRRGDQIEIAQVNVEQLHQGDIVTIVETADLLTHRLWRKSSDHLLTRGDHLLRFDTAVSPPQILGKVVARHRRHALNLESGLGRTLHAQLSQSTETESNWLAQDKRPPTHLWIRVRHRFHHHWRQLLVSLVDLLLLIQPK